MTSLFLSHSSRDRAAVEQLGDRLRADGITGLFLDFDPADGIPAGRNWEQELYAQLRRTDAVVFLASESSVASAWCFAELTLARSLRKTIVPVRLPGAPRLALLDDVQWVDWDDAGYASLLGGLRQAGLDPAGAFGGGRGGGAAAVRVGVGRGGGGRGGGSAGGRCRGGPRGPRRIPASSPSRP